MAVANQLKIIGKHLIEKIGSYKDILPSFEMLLLSDHVSVVEAGIAGLEYLNNIQFSPEDFLFVFIKNWICNV